MSSKLLPPLSPSVSPIKLIDRLSPVYSGFDSDDDQGEPLIADYDDEDIYLYIITAYA